MRQGFFGVKNAHIALLTDEDELTYETPVHIPGTVEIQADPEVNDDPSYADNEVWIRHQVDNGFTGTFSCFDTESTAELRALFAKLTGYAIDTNGRVLGLTDREPQPFAFMCEQPGSVTGKRRCFLKCQFKKPSMDAATQEDSPEITQLDYEFTAFPVTITHTTGEGASAVTTEMRMSFYDDYSGSATYNNFFNAVVTDFTEASA